MKKVRVEVPYFAGTIDAYVFSDWLASLESYFEGYDMSDESKVQFCYYEIYWTSLDLVERCGV